MACPIKTDDRILTTTKPQNWAALPPSRVVDTLQTNPCNGLSASQVEQRRIQFGPNLISETGSTPWPTVLARQFVDVLIWTLIGAAAISFAIGEVADAATIMAIVVLNGILGFVQEWKAEQALLALRQMLSPMCRVLRQGDTLVIATADLVPGDIVRLETGDRIPADLRLLEATNLRVDESALTGESGSVAKHTVAVESSADLAEQSSMS